MLGLYFCSGIGTVLRIYCFGLLDTHFRVFRNSPMRRNAS